MRRLGVGGGGGGGGDRPLRAQLVIALVIGLVLLAVPLYLWRRPSGKENAAPDASARHDAGKDGAPTSHAEVTGLDAGADDGVKLAPVQRVKCSASPGSKGQQGNLCDRLPFFEGALEKSIHGAKGCAPRTGKSGTLNYVLTVDFQHRRVGVFPGASGQWKGPQARRATKCVLKSLPPPPWDRIQHQYRYYMIAVLATYPGPGALPGPAGAPVFEPHH